MSLSDTGSDTSVLPTSYPSTYGAECAAHDLNLSPECTGDNPPDSCGAEWCFVDASCALTEKTEAYGLYKSYSNCAAQEAFAADPCAAASSESACGALRPQTADCSWDATANFCNPIPVDCEMTAWENGGCSVTCGEGVEIQTRTIETPARFGGTACGATENSVTCRIEACGSSQQSSQTACGTAAGAIACAQLDHCAFDEGQCVDSCDCRSLPDGIDFKGRPTTYGATCAPHDEGMFWYAEYCIPSIPDEGTPDPGVPNDWCDDSWCYVQPECPLSDLAETSTFAVSQLYYSYVNCGGVDTFQSLSCTETNDLVTCGSMMACAFDGGSCKEGCDCMSLSDTGSDTS